MADAGWRHARDEVGDTFSIFNLPDRTVQLIAGIRHGLHHQTLDAMLSVSTEAFSLAYRTIGQSGSHASAPLCVNRNGLRLRVEVLTGEDVVRFLADALLWARDVDLAEALKEHVDRPTNAPGNRPLLHLAALAVTSKLDRLLAYQRAFAAGDRLDFVPYITEGYVDRAVAVCAAQGA